MLQLNGGTSSAFEVQANVMMGKPCLEGTRIPVYLVLEKLAAGESAQQILNAYPQLKP